MPKFIHRFLMFVAVLLTITQFSQADEGNKRSNEELKLLMNQLGSHWDDPHYLEYLASSNKKLPPKKPTVERSASAATSSKHTLGQVPERAQTANLKGLRKLLFQPSTDNLEPQLKAMKLYASELEELGYQPNQILEVFASGAAQTNLARTWHDHFETSESKPQQLVSLDKTSGLVVPNIQTGKVQHQNLAKEASRASEASTPELANSSGADGETKGWFWYNWQDSNTEEESAESQQPTPEPEMDEVQLEMLVKESLRRPPVPTNITTAWLTKNLPKFMELAMDNPTDENILSYLYLQSYAVQKATKFSDQAQLLTQGNPILDNNAAFPSLAVSRPYREQFAQRFKGHLIENLNHHFALLMLIGDDYESKTFSGLVSLLAERYGVSLTFANTTGKEIPELQGHPQITDQAEVFRLIDKTKAISVPTLYGIDAKDTKIIVSGPVDMEALEQRIINYLRTSGLINETEYNYARGKFVETSQDGSTLSDLINFSLKEQGR